MALKRSQKIAKTTVRTKQYVNLLPAYEQMIAEKLEGVEIPDMADAIWARIETALDVEMPVNDTPAVIKNPAVWIISAGILALIIALFILFRSGTTAPSPQPDLPQHTQPAIKPDTMLKQDLTPPAMPKHNPDKNKRKPFADTAAFKNKGTDSLLKIPPAIIAPPVIISPPAVKAPPAGTLNPSVEIKPRKKYGVEVPDSGYRFNMKPKE